MPKDVHCTKQHGFLLNASRFYSVYCHRGTLMGGGGAQSLPTMIFFLCLSPQMSVMYFHDDSTPTALWKFCHNFFRLENVLDSPPPPPPPPGRLAAQFRGISPPLTKHPGTAPVYTYTVRAPVFGRHQFFGSSEHYGKPMEVYYLDEWIIITLHVAGFLHPAIF